MSEEPPSMPPRSVRSPPGALERLLLIDGSFLASVGNVFLQIRRGDLRNEAFDQVSAAFMRHRALTPRGALYGAIVLTEPGASIPPETVRTRQRALVVDFLKHPTARMAVVVVGETLNASLLRSASRGVVPSHPQLRIFGQPEGACEWMAEQLGISAAQLLAALKEARALAERELSAPLS
jgi:hypothetical protein